MRSGEAVTQCHDFFFVGTGGGGGRGRAVLTIKQIDGGYLKERRVGFFKKSYYSLKRLLISWKLLRLLKLFIY